MTRGTLLAVALLCVLLGAVVFGAKALIARDRRELAERYAADRMVQVDEAAELSRRDLEGVAVVLRLANELLEEAGPDSTHQHERELKALLAASEQFAGLTVYSADGVQTLSVANPRLAPNPQDNASAAELTQAAQRALARPGELQISSPILGPRHPLRVFAISLEPRKSAPRKAVALLVDSERLLSKLRVLSTDPTTWLLLLGPHGRPSGSSDPRLAAAAQGGVTAPTVIALLEKLRAGERGTLWMNAVEANALGLGDAEVVCAFTPLPTEGLGRWSLAVLTSTAPLRAAEKNLTGRLLVASGAIAVLLVAFGVFVVMAARRAALTRERLVHAEKVARLHERTERTLDNIPAGVMSLTASSNVSAMNRVLRQRVPQAQLPCPLAQALPDAPTAVLERLAALVAEAERQQAVQSLHGERLALFGSEGQYSVHAVPLGTAFDEVHALLVFDDVSEVRSLESQLLRAEKLATIGVLAAGLAHEVGTPLGIVRARAEYVLGKLGEQHGQARGLQVIIDQIDRVTRTIRQMLDFARVRPAAVKPVALKEVATWLKEVLRYEAQRRKVSLTVELPDGLPDVSADPDQLQQLLLNLVMNAYDACKEGGHVRVTAGLADGAWRSMRFEVTDDGCGIAEEHRQGVFDPFFTTKKGGQGTGLGLTVAAQIVRNHGGQIELHSELGEGTRVVVLWPLAKGEGPRKVESHAA